MPGFEELIARAPVFAGLTTAHLESIAACARSQNVDAGSLLLRDGEPADSFYLIRTGAIVLELHAPGRAPLLVETLHEHDVVGWSWLLAPFRWQMDGRAIRECGVVAFDAACLRAKCRADSELGYELMGRFAALVTERLQATRLQLVDVYGHPSVTS